MAKYHGYIGYAQIKETAPGVWEEIILEKEAYGDTIRNFRRLNGAEQLNDNIKLNQEISIVATPFAVENFQYIRYATYMGTKWKVNSVDASQYPRLILDMGEVYNAVEENDNTEENSVEENDNTEENENAENEN